MKSDYCKYYGWLNNPELSKDDVSDPKLAEDRARFEQQLKDQWEN